MSSIKVIVTGRNAALTSWLQLWMDSGSGMVKAGMRGIPYSDALDLTLRIRRQHLSRSRVSIQSHLLEGLGQVELHIFHRILRKL